MTESLLCSVWASFAPVRRTRLSAETTAFSQVFFLLFPIWSEHQARDDHYPVSRLHIWQDSEFASGSGHPKTAFKWEPDTDIRNAFIDISRIETFGKSFTLHNHSFVIFRSIFSAFCAMTPSLSMV